MAGQSRQADAFDGQVTAAQQTSSAGRSLSVKKLFEVPGA
jgi:hypothetical protein